MLCEFYFSLKRKEKKHLRKYFLSICENNYCSAVIATSNFLIIYQIIGRQCEGRSISSSTFFLKVERVTVIQLKNICTCFHFLESINVQPTLAII